MNKRLTIRILADLCLAFSIINGWWFVALVIAIPAVWFEPFFVEMIVAGVAYDSLFGMVRTMGLKGYIASIIAVALYVIISFLKRTFRR